MEKAVNHNYTFKQDEVVYKEGNSTLRMLLRTDCNTGSVLQADGAIKDVAACMKQFMKDYPDMEVSNQVHRDSEAKAMFRAGLRLQDFNLSQTLAMLQKRLSIHMTYAAGK